MALVKDYLYCQGFFSTLASIDKDFKESIEQIKDVESCFITTGAAAHVAEKLLSALACFS